MRETFAVELVRVTKRFGETVAVDDATLQIRDGEFFSLLGPSGCGKTTSLRLIAGFETPSAGEVWIGGRPMGTTPAYRRPVNTVFQNYALFPHINVFGNVAFGLEMQRRPRGEIERRVRETLEMVQLPGMERRRPRELSGGQQQRVALARALVNQPKVLLLDEPLGALDLKLRKAMQLELKALQDRVGITFLYVTHDQEEALTMSDRIAVMDRGRILQIGTSAEIYERPANRFVADFIGETNFLEAEVTRSQAEPDRGWRVELLLPDGSPVAAFSGRDFPVRTKVTLAVRPEKVQFDPAPGWNRLPAIVEGRVYHGSSMRYLLRMASGAAITAWQPNTGSVYEPIAREGPVQVGWSPEVGMLFAREGWSEGRA